ncbi:ABC transporter transmembrane domain-containing protein [Chelatococcus sp. SYSU_G07232]|uniref:ABC transporter transmembrane domain-containing protein n=1 Tax=Chelatococcus albus TaxID=3047466 RepID=A0ABT7AJ94_9HYPH|nr:ABC transporter transmembrane domain-containing protein [Chelatococcus sp. SYSU_G07232]MDJ1159451.1 ABC transporter transmembrane domain-containing protein [Chelatococcus sp. SYSU_G07232]
MEKSLFRYIWRHTRREQLVIFAAVLASLPFYFWSLDLPKRIVNEAIQGGAFKDGRATATFLEIGATPPALFGGGPRVTFFEGFTVGQLGLLFGLSTLFLVLVLVNGAFKYWINVAKGALGERMLRRMRFDLFSLTFRFPPETLRTVKASETATIIKDEVEPIGGFIGDAFIQPMFLGTQAATAMLFILLQNVWLGIIAASIVGIQFVVIPRLRRVQLRLGKERQIASRKLAGRVGEIVDGMEAVHVHDATAWEKAEIGERLFHLFDLRFRIYKWKFAVKFLNNLLAQITPFFFYSVGGYFALKGKLDIGQLVAVIAAYRELPPPLKELIDWDQQRLDVQIKYDQITQQFAPERLIPEEVFAGAEADAEPLRGPLVVKDLRVMDSHGSPLVEGASFAWDLPARIALVGDGGGGPSVLARVLARRIDDFTGQISIGGRDLRRLPEAVTGRRLTYAGVDPILFPGTLRDNLVYGLRHRPVRPGAAGDDAEQRRRRLEASRTGNPEASPDDEWIDYAALGLEGADELDHRLLEELALVGMRDDVYRFGLSGRVDPARYPHLAEKLVEARGLLRAKLADRDMRQLVEPFDPARYNNQATIGENLLFGASVGGAFAGRARAVNPLVRRVLDAEDLTDELVRMGGDIAQTMTEIFRGLPPGHPLFEQFSFIAADDLPEYEDIVRRWATRRASGLTREDRNRLLVLPLDYVEPRHRLGLIDDVLKARIVEARMRFRRELRGTLWEQEVELYDAERVCGAAPLRDNLLFGRVAHGIADARERVTKVAGEVISELGMRDDIARVGLDFQVGPGGRLLTAQQRASVALVRCLVKQPDILVLDGALASYGDAQAASLLATITEAYRGRSLVAVLRDEAQAADFDILVRFTGPRPQQVRGPLAPAAEGGEAGVGAGTVQQPLRDSDKATTEPEFERQTP